MRTSFVGRKRQLETLRALFRRGRVVTLVGAPGVGTTRDAFNQAYPQGHRSAWTRR
jgi:predicted ATPase